MPSRGAVRGSDSFGLAMPVIMIGPSDDILRIFYSRLPTFSGLWAVNPDVGTINTSMCKVNALGARSSGHKCLLEVEEVELRGSYFQNSLTLKVLPNIQIDPIFKDHGKNDMRHFKKWNTCLHALGILFSKVPHEILHSINVSPNTQKIISEVFTLDVRISDRSPTKGCGWIIEMLLAFCTRVARMPM